jgi:signal recognition particle receptor subunit alpha
MLDAFEVVTTSGVVLWSRTYAPVGPHVVNSLINDVFIEEKIRTQDSTDGVLPVYKKDKYTLKWKRVKDLGLIFVVSYQRSTRLIWMILIEGMIVGSLSVAVAS